MMLVRRGTALVAVALVCVACATTKRPDGQATASASSSLPAPSPDELLQIRLRQAAEELDLAHAARDPAARTSLGDASGAPLAETPGIRAGTVTVQDGLPGAVVQRIVRQNVGRLKHCYESGLKKDATLAGDVVVRFTIDGKGRITKLTASGELADQSVITCVKQAFSALGFPAPETKAVAVIFPLRFMPHAAAVPTNPPAPVQRAPLAPPDGPWPVVAIEAQDIRIGDQVVGSVAAATAGGRVGRVAGVFETLKARRARFEKAHPGVRMPTVAGLRVKDGTPLLALKNVFQTMAFAGYPDIQLQLSSEPNTIVALSAEVPPADDEPPRPPPPRPPAVLHLRGLQYGVKLTWKRGSNVEEESTVPTEPAKLAAAVCASWRARGSHRDAADPMLDHAVIHGAEGSDVVSVVALARATESCTRERRDPSGAVETVPAFWRSFTLR